MMNRNGDSDDDMFINIGIHQIDGIRLCHNQMTNNHNFVMINLMNYLYFWRS